MLSHFAPSPLVLGLLSVLLAAQIACAVHLFRLFRKRSRFYGKSDVVDGLVTASRQYPGYDGRQYFANVTYAVAGTQYFLKDGFWTSSRRYRRGERVRIRYLPESPADGYVDRQREPVLYLAAFLVLLVPVAICGALLVLAIARS